MFVTLSSALFLQTEIHEYYVRVRHPIIGWLLIGLIAGWLAGKLSRGRGFGCITDIVLGLIGGILGGWIFSKLGVGGDTTRFLYSFAAVTVSARIILANAP